MWAFGLHWGRQCPSDHWAWTVPWLSMVVTMVMTSGDLCPHDTGWDSLGSDTWLFGGSPLSAKGCVRGCTH